MEAYLIHLTSLLESCREMFWLLFYLLCWLTTCWKRPRRSLTLELLRHPTKSLNDLDFADDITLLESLISRAQAQLTKTAEAAANLGLVISAPKTEYITVNCNPQPALQVYGDSINHVSDFRYLGSMVASGSSDLKRRKSLAWCAFWKLEQLWKSPHISIATKVKLFNTTCVTILLYGCESWVISKDMENKINAFATSCYRVMLNIKRIDHVLNTTVYSMTNTVPLIHLVRQRQLKFLGHILRISKEEPARRYALYIPTIGKRRPGRPRTSYLNYVQRLLGDNEGAMQEQQIAASADDRHAWRNLVVAYSAADGWWWWRMLNKICNCVSEKIAFEKLRTVDGRYAPPYTIQMIKID